jgi:hypothetical protein
LAWPRLEHLADAARFDQGIEGFLDHIQLANFELFMERAASWTGNPVRRAERQTAKGLCRLDAGFLAGLDTLIIIGFDSSPTMQRPDRDETEAIRAFLANPDHTLFVCPHHDIGDVEGLPDAEHKSRQEAEFHHHGDPAIPARQRFGDFAIALLEDLGLPVRNRFGLRPAVHPDGSPAPLNVASGFDRFGVMTGVASFNAHLHLPHFERSGESLAKLEVLARQAIDLRAPAHPFTAHGQSSLDALLQSGPGVFPGRLLICDTTIWSSTVGGLSSLQRFWENIATLPRHDA